MPRLRRVRPGRRLRPDGKLEIAVPVLDGTLVCLNAARRKEEVDDRTPVTGDVVAAT